MRLIALANNNLAGKMNILLLLAGGVGSRIGSDIPKQFIEVNSIPLIVYTLKTFQSIDRIDSICVVSHNNWVDKVWEYRAKYKLDKINWVVPGGRTGLESVKNGIDVLNDINGASIILIHDSVRPFVTPKAILDNIKVAEEHDVAVTSVPCVETLVKVDSQFESIEQIPRDGLMRVMTPQSFRLSLLRDLFRNEDVLNCKYPSTFALYMSKGNSVYCSFGSERNIKITYPEDVDYLKGLFERFEF